MNEQKTKRTVYIILVNYNSGDVTKSCIKSLIKSDYTDFGIIVVDNGSSDDSVQILDNYIKSIKSSITIELIKETNRGFAAGNNRGIVKGLSYGADYILLLNNDTVVDRTFLCYLLEPFKKNIDCGITTAKILYDSVRDKIWYDGGSFNFLTGNTTHFNYNKRNVTVSSEVKSVTFASGCCLCISKKCLQSVGLLEEKYFLYEEDTEYCIRAMEQGFQIYYNPKAVIYHKVNASTSKINGLIDYYMIRNKLFCIDDHFHGIYKRIAKFHCILMFLKRVLTGNCDLDYVKLGFLDYKNHISGKKLS